MLSPSSLFSFLRRFAIAMVLVVAVAAVGVVGGKAYGKKKFGESRTIDIPDGIMPAVNAGDPANFLLIGLDTRPANESAAEAKAFGTQADTGGSRSDVMMVLHVDPRSHTGMLVSFPRDLVVDIPGHGRNLLNAAYAFGGPALVIQTIQENFKPLGINHYIEVDFRGFRSIVDAIGHIHIWFPTPANDEWTGLHEPGPGGGAFCATLNGVDALAYARSRHYNVPRDLQNPAPWNPQGTEKHSVGWIEDPRADLDRIPRQQYFLRTISQAAIDKTGSDPFAVTRLLGAVFHNFGHDQHLTFQQLADLALTFRGLNPAKVQMMTLPVVAAPYPGWSAHVIAKFPDANPVIAQLANFPTPAPYIPRPIAADRVRVKVVNGSGIKGAATRALADFTNAGFVSAGPAEDASRSDYTKTQVRYAPGKFAQGFTAAYALGTQNLVEAASAKNTLGGDVLVIVGRDYDSLHLNFDAVPHSSKTTTTQTATGGSTPAGASTTTVATTTTLPRETVDTRFVPVDPKTGGPLVGCPTKR